MSTTPRTEAERDRNQSMSGKPAVSVEFARTLETELAEAAKKEAESANVIIQFMDRLDLNRDEFLRIKAVADNPEIVHLCERSQVRIVQTVPVIEQRYAALKKLHSAQQRGDEWKEMAKTLASRYVMDVPNATRSSAYESYEALMKKEGK